MAVREHAPATTPRREAIASELSVDAMRAALEAVNAASPFNASARMQIGAVAVGAVTLACASAPGLLNHAGALHAGVQAALIDTACGFAAGPVAGPVVTAQMSLTFLAPARGNRFEARARVVKAGRSQVFANAELFAMAEGGEERLVATGTAVLVRVG